MVYLCKSLRVNSNRYGNSRGWNWVFYENLWLKGRGNGRSKSDYNPYLLFSYNTQFCRLRWLLSTKYGRASRMLSYFPDCSFCLATFSKCSDGCSCKARESIDRQQSDWRVELILFGSYTLQSQWINKTRACWWNHKLLLQVLEWWQTLGH